MAKAKARPRNAKSDKLTKRQEDFARAYVKTGNATEAYRQAYTVSGMTPKSVNEEACHTLAIPKISSRVEALLAPGFRKAALDAEGTVLEMARVANETPEKAITYGEKISALALLAKHYGLFEKDNKQRAENMALEIVLVAAKK